MNSRIDIIGTNGNDGEHYNNPKWNKPNRWLEIQAEEERL